MFDKEEIRVNLSHFERTPSPFRVRVPEYPPRSCYSYGLSQHLLVSARCF